MEAREPVPTNPYAPPTVPLEDGDRRVEAFGEYRPLFPLATFITVMLAIHVVIVVASIANAGVTMSIMNRLQAGEPAETLNLSGIDVRSGALNILQRGVNIVLIILFCVLMPRANRNARWFARMPMEFTPGWAAGYFFVPVLNLWRPYQAMKEIWLASDPEPPDPRLNARYAYVSALLPVWWGVFVARNILAQISSGFGKHLNEPEDFISAGRVQIVAWTVAIAAAVLATALVRELAKRQDGAAAQRRSFLGY
jgi:hypothetical protein